MNRALTLVLAAALLGISNCDEPDRRQYHEPGFPPIPIEEGRPAISPPAPQEESMQDVNGIQDGEILEQGTPDLTLRTVGLTLMKDGQKTKVPNGNLTITANASGNPRVDMIQWNGTTLSVKAGTAAADPACPSPDAGYVPIAIVYVPTGFTSVRSLGTLTVQGVMIAVYSSTRGLFACTARSGGPQNVAGTTPTELTGSSLPIYIPRGGSSRYRVGFNGAATFNDANATLNLRVDLDGVAETPTAGFLKGDIGSSGGAALINRTTIPHFGIGSGQCDIQAGPRKFKVFAFMGGAAEDADINKHAHTIEQLY